MAKSPKIWTAEEVGQLTIDFDEDLAKRLEEPPATWECEHDSSPLLEVVTQNPPAPVCPSSPPSLLLPPLPPAGLDSQTEQTLLQSRLEEIEDLTAELIMCRTDLETWRSRYYAQIDTVKNHVLLLAETTGKVVKLENKVLELQPDYRDAVSGVGDSIAVIDSITPIESVPQIKSIPQIESITPSSQVDLLQQELAFAREDIQKLQKKIEELSQKVVHGEFALEAMSKLEKQLAQSTGNSTLLKQSTENLTRLLQEERRNSSGQVLEIMNLNQLVEILSRSPSDIDNEIHKMQADCDQIEREEAGGADSLAHKQCIKRMHTWIDVKHRIEGYRSLHKSGPGSTSQPVTQPRRPAPRRRSRR